jgi:hypothetical protein
MSDIPVIKQQMVVYAADGKVATSLLVSRHIDHEEANLAVAMGARSAVIRDENGAIFYEVKRIDGAQATWRTATMASPALMAIVELTMWHGARYSLGAFIVKFGGRLEFPEGQD